MAFVKFSGVLFFREKSQYTKNTTIHMYLLIEISHNIPIQCHIGIVLRWKNFIIMLEIDILRNYPQKYLGVLRGVFVGIGSPKDTQTPYWLGLWLGHFIGTHYM